MQSHHYLFHGHPISQPCGPQDAKIKKRKENSNLNLQRNPTEMKPNARGCAKAWQTIWEEPSRPSPRWLHLKQLEGVRCKIPWSTNEASVTVRNPLDRWLKSVRQLNLVECCLFFCPFFFFFTDYCFDFTCYCMTPLAFDLCCWFFVFVKCTAETITPFINWLVNRRLTLNSFDNRSII